MWALFKKVFNDCFTLSDGTSFDLGRILWCWGVIWYTGCGLYAVFGNKQMFDYVNAGTGIGLALAGGGAALWAKRSSEDPPK